MLCRGKTTIQCKRKNHSSPTHPVRIHISLALLSGSKLYMTERCTLGRSLVGKSPALQLINCMYVKVNHQHHPVPWAFASS